MSSTPCENCENKGYIILDTNFLIFLLDYLHIQNRRIGIRDYCSRLKDILLVISGCSINGKLYVSKRLFDHEIDYSNNSRAALFGESQKFNRGYRSEIKMVLGVIKPILSIIPVDTNDLSLLQDEANICFANNPPGENDCSLILLALNLSNSDSDGNPSLLISGDTKMKIFQEKHLIGLGSFENHRKEALKCDVFDIEDSFNPLARVYSCCKLDTIDDYYDLYCEKVKFLLRVKIEVKRSFDRKFDIFKEIAINKHKFDLIKQKNLEEGVCVE